MILLDNRWAVAVPGDDLVTGTPSFTVVTVDRRQWRVLLVLGDSPGRGTLKVTTRAAETAALTIGNAFLPGARGVGPLGQVDGVTADARPRSLVVHRALRRQAPLAVLRLNGHQATPARLAYPGDTAARLAAALQHAAALLE
ncbi:hypothetical protein C1701_04750 [Actinoalloteichus sp. AHMU CJ021]|uniref:Uncharacterized protein n=1 Tax=Actinoalloteichus caeruleus DSM 43889 TaxID=1120930 RepID=A0ABT1JGW4_ACTCY|nr:hypothetical protein [Actinoalloteichus caeruleus]AUS77784.1 hypothetical protein C1701_04750 [Actinoalloteichus sp. AHMU CJ021]MCP2331731.1 hypothetical protein [Actinoalloteichus caeruleus DSM 43889]